MLRNKEALIDIERAARRILRYSSGVSRAELEIDDEKLSAILYQTSQLLERRPKEYLQSFVNEYPEIPWKNMAGMGGLLVHEYNQIDIDVVWNVIQNKLLELLILLEPLQ